ncbi:MAG: 2-amino-4-hydroxy-6-hydroxymethyldihydropteridine diphosphokinase [Tannerella sp.]|jgi:2-amino-4-hydroxy-6-hydroxymethyldihydropteridine diphosphokinase|nr:2-amino-4-hydroxy-6-hydroxymethyldihydropteridine diphosphokinase [Tannerella sp.]
MVYLGLGSNIGDRRSNIRQAVELIRERVGEIHKLSSLIETEPWGYDSSEKYINAVISLETTLTPLQLLQTTQQIERDMGRTTKSLDGIYADRIIDIDILIYNDLKINTPQLTVPHPQMYRRDFVMQPLKEIADSNNLFTIFQ